MKSAYGTQLKFHLRATYKNILRRINCHTYFTIGSALTIATSLSFTINILMAYGVLLGSEDYEDNAFCCFPYYFIKTHIIALFRGADKISDKKLFRLHVVKFTECFMESVPQLSLTFLLINKYETPPSDLSIQIFSMTGKFLKSICM